MAQHGVALDEGDSAEAAQFLEQKMDEVNGDMTRNSWMQMTVIVIGSRPSFGVYDL